MKNLTDFRKTGGKRYGSSPDCDETTLFYIPHDYS